jgi:hypothetical protein
MQSTMPMPMPGSFPQPMGVMPMGQQMMGTPMQPMGMQPMGMPMQPMGMPMQPMGMGMPMATEPTHPAQPAPKANAQTLPQTATMGSTSSLKANIVQIAGCLDAQQGQELDISGLRECHFDCMRCCVYEYACPRA